MLKRETFFKSFWNIQRNCGVLLVPNQKVYKEASKDWNRKCVTACFVQIFRILKNCFLKFISNNLIKNFVDFCIIFMDSLQIFAFSLRCVQLESVSCRRRLLQLVHGYLTKFINVQGCAEVSDRFRTAITGLWVIWQTFFLDQNFSMRLKITKKICFRLIILNVIKNFFTKEKKLSDDS